MLSVNSWSRRAKSIGLPYRWKHFVVVTGGAQTVILDDPAELFTGWEPPE